MEVHRSVLNRTSFPFYIGKREILLYWFTNRAFFKLLEMLISIVALKIIYSSEITLDLDPMYRRIIASSSGGSLAIYAVLWSAHIVGTPAQAPLEAVFGIIILLTSAASFYLGIGTYGGKIDSMADEKQKAFAIMAFGLLVQSIDLMCLLVCKDHKNCFYKMMLRKKQKLDSRPRPTVNLRKKSTMYVRDPLSDSFSNSPFIPNEEVRV